MAYFSKSGHQQWGPIDLHDFWASVGNTSDDFNSDPHTRFDPDTGRFYVIMQENLSDQAYIYVAVSKNDNPQSATDSDWYLYRLDGAENSGGQKFGVDYPQLGFDRQAIYVTCNMFQMPLDSPTTQFHNCQILILNKAAFISGSGAFSRVFTDSDVPQTLQPATVIGSGSAPNVAYFCETPQETSTAVRIWAVSDPLGAATLSSVTVPIPDNGGPIFDAPQNGTTNKLDTVSPATQGNAFWYNGSLWFCNTAGGSSGRAKVYYYKVDANNFPSGTPTLTESGAIDGGPGVWTYQASIGGNARGDVCIVYTRSSASSNPAILCVARLGIDSRFSRPYLLKQSATHSSDYRWGDFATVTADPVDQSFWVSHEWVTTSGDWGTWWANVKAYDITRPTLTTSLPVSHTFSNATSVTLTGVAKDNVAVQQVYYRVGDGAFELATGTTNWSASVDLAPGTNVVTVYCVDWTGNISKTNVYVLFDVVTSTLTLQTNGSGRIVSVKNRYGNPTDGAELPLGRTFVVSATPSSGNLFRNWTQLEDGTPTVVSTNTKLGFIMQSNLILQANFTPNPFAVGKGTYVGLFSDTNGVAQNSAGSLTLTLTSSGAYSAAVKVGGGSYSFSGRFNADAVTSKTVSRSGKSPLVFNATLDNTNRQITGVISTPEWSATLVAPKTGTTSKFAGKYTLAFPGVDGSTTMPVGDGFGTLSVSSSGRVTFSGSLADGTAIAQSVPSSTEGEWPVYIPVSKGLVTGWLAFTNAPGNTVSGTLAWIKGQGSAKSLYPAGFTNPAIAVIASPFQAPRKGTAVLAMSDATVEFRASDPTLSSTNLVVLKPTNTAVLESGTGPTTNGFSMTFSASTGLFSGHWTDSTTKKSVPFKGVVLQDQNEGRGYFLGTTQAGRVILH